MSEIRSQATPARDELAGLIHAEICEESLEDCLDPDWRGKCARAADVLLPAGWSKPRTVNSAAELDALPNMSVVMDNCEDVSQKRGGQWCGYETADLTSKQIAKYGPLTVLFTPGDAG